jgi:hypothetical protein
MPEKKFFLWSKGQGAGYIWTDANCDEDDGSIHGVISATEGFAAIFSEVTEGYYVNSRELHEEMMRAILMAKWIPATADQFRADIYTYNDKSGLYEKGTYTVDRYKLSGRMGQLLRDVGDAARRTGVTLGVIDIFLWTHTYLSMAAGWVPGFSVSPMCTLLMFLFGALLYGFGLLLQYVYERVYGYTKAVEVS